MIQVVLTAEGHGKLYSGVNDALQTNYKEAKLQNLGEGL